MQKEKEKKRDRLSRQDEEAWLAETLSVVCDNVANYRKEVSRMQADIDEMLAHYHDNDTEVLTILNNTVTLHEHMKRALLRNEKAMHKPYFGRIIFQDEKLHKRESLYIGKGGISRDKTHWMVVDWRAPVANVYYENGLGPCSYAAPNDTRIRIDLELKRTYEIEDGRLLDYFDTEVVANDDLLTKYLAKNKQAVLGEIIATIQKEQNEIIRKSPYHNIIVQGVAGSGKTTVAMHRISFILYNYPERFRPDDFYIVGSNRILLDYITGVLPDLDVYGVRQMTMEQLFARLLYEDWDEKKYQIIPADRLGAGSSCKGTLSWFRDLESYCLELEWKTIPRESIYLNPRQFVEGIRDGKTGVFDLTEGQRVNPADLKELVPGEVIERYIRQNPSVSIQSKINMLNDRLMSKIKEEFLGKGVSYTENERRAIRKAYRGRYGGKVWKKSVFELYRDFLTVQSAKGYQTAVSEDKFDVYDLAALAYLYKRVKETEVISEAHHIVIDEAQDFGIMAYCVLKFCIKDCTYTIMGDISQNIHFGYGLNDWQELTDLLLTDDMDSFGILKKSYRNTVEISDFATNILHHGQFAHYPAEPVLRHGVSVMLQNIADKNDRIKAAASLCKEWQQKGLNTIAVICRNQRSASETAGLLGQYVGLIENNPEKMSFGNGIMVLPVEYTKGLEFDAVLILNPTRKDYPVDDGHAKLLYVAATRALHELCILHDGNLTGLIADPPQNKITDATEFNIRDRNLPFRSPASGRIEHSEKEAPAGQHIRKSRTGDSISLRQKPSVSGSNIHRPEPESGKPPQIPVRQPAVLTASSPHMKTNRNPVPGNKPVLSFGDMPPTEKLRPAGHSRIDLAVRWTARQPDGLYLQSRYGTLRLSPVGSAIVRVTFAKGQQPAKDTNPCIAVHHIDQTWMYRESGNTIELLTDELCLRIDKITGAIHYMTRDRKPLLSERGKECRQIETGTNGRNQTWLFLDLPKAENLYGMGTQTQSGMNLRKTARYIFPGIPGELPFLVSDNGYGILIASDNPTIFCDVPAYGSYFHTENETQIDFYFIAGKRQNTILNAYAYLLGKL